MRVNDRMGAKPSGLAGQANGRPAGAGGFTLSAPPPAQDSVKTASVQVTRDVSALFELQMATNSPQDARKRTVRRGAKLLDGLDRLTAALLIGEDKPADWDALLREFQAPRDPNLPKEAQSLLDDVDVRVAVELAKRGR